MRLCSGIRSAVTTLTLLAGLSLAVPAHADSGHISFEAIRAGWVIGGPGGSGTLVFHGHRYRLSNGGLSYGLVFGASETYFSGTIRHVHSPYEVSGVYGAAGAGDAVGCGARAMVLTNAKGAVLEIIGRQKGLMINVDLSGLAITVH